MTWMRAKKADSSPLISYLSNSLVDTIGACNICFCTKVKSSLFLLSFLCHVA